MKSLELIEKERLEQIAKHGRTIEGDRAMNTHGELKDAALFVLTDDAIHYPKEWSMDFFKKIRAKTYMERLIIAAALLAAEIDRKDIDEDEEPVDTHPDYPDDGPYYYPGGE